MRTTEYPLIFNLLALMGINIISLCHNTVILKKLKIGNREVIQDPSIFIACSHVQSKVRSIRLRR